MIMEGWERTSVVGCAEGARSLVSWFVGVGQIGEGYGLLKIGSGGGKLCDIKTGNSMFLFYDSMFSAGGHIAENGRMMHGCEW